MNVKYRHPIKEGHPIQKDSIDITDTEISCVPKLDLHGIKHNDVQREVENFVLLNKPPLSIITGMSDKMRELVGEVLEEYDFLWNIPINNYGMIKVIKNYK